MKKVLFLMTYCIFLITFCHIFAQQPERKYNAEGYKGISDNDKITFGVWDQDWNYENGSEPIEWIILSVENDRALILSKYPITSDVFDMKSSTPISWQNSHIRYWLNSDFYDSAFNDAERARILKVTLLNQTETNDTNDQIFLLSIDEVNQYVKESDRKLEESSYRYNWPERIKSGDHYLQWWLRSEGQSENTISYVSIDGTIDAAGIDYYGNNIGIRPAMWINLRPSDTIEPIHQTGLQKLWKLLVNNDKVHLIYQIYHPQNDSTIFVETNMKDGKLHMRTSENGETTIEFYQNNSQYLLNPDTESGIVIDDDYLLIVPLYPDLLYRMVNSVYHSRIDFSESVEEFNGVSLHMETYPTNKYHPNTIFYFDNNDQLLYIHNEARYIDGKLIENEKFYTIQTIDDNVDDILFNISSYSIEPKEIKGIGLGQ